MKKYPDITQFIQQKNEHRKSMASLPFKEKVKIAFDLNRRHKFIKSGRLVPPPSSSTNDLNTKQNQKTSHTMNKSKLKSYAPQARRDFRDAVTARAATLGLSPDSKTTVEVKGDLAVIDGQPYPRIVAELRERLLERIKREGFEQFVEEIAYTWFNRFTALRFMEINGFLSHGLRVLSNPDESKDEPEILEKAHTIELPGLTRERVVELKLAANKEAELYRMLLVAQCNQLSATMPFLFERINDETELLLPDNLLHSDSLIRKLVTEIDEEDWGQVEIIGWLYQFYISERKDEVIGKVVKSEDIPAATQLFTPNWIVKYMTQNSLGRMWLQTYPESGLRAKMEYYIEPAEQSEEVKRELARLTPESINPEEIKILDPACGSGHILVEAYELLKEIYRERGYSSRDIPRLILEKNLYGLDIDERATQLASFALLMKARADDRRILGVNPPRLNVLAIPEHFAENAKDLAAALHTKPEPKRAVSIIDDAALFADVEAQPSLVVAAPTAEDEGQRESAEVTLDEVVKLLGLFSQGKTLGSLIEISDEMRRGISVLNRLIGSKLASAELMERTAAEQVAPFLLAARILAQKYDCVIANPPYMYSNFFNSILKEHVKKLFPNTKSDLFAVFVERLLLFVKPLGYLAVMTPFVWMFLKSYEGLRKLILNRASICSLVQPEYHAFFDSAYVPISSYIIANHRYFDKAEFFSLAQFYGAEQQPLRFKEAIENPGCQWRYQTSISNFSKVPGCPIVYSVGPNVFDLFAKGVFLSDVVDLKIGLQPGDTEKFMRFWYEVSFEGIKFDQDSRLPTTSKWYPCIKTGEFRKWIGNTPYIVNWLNNGEDVRTCEGARPQNTNFYFKKGVTWGMVTSSTPSARLMEEGYIFDNSSPSLFDKSNNELSYLGFLNSKVATYLLNILNPTLNLSTGTVGSLPALPEELKLDHNVEEMCDIAKKEVGSFETSWNFKIFPFLREDLKRKTVAASFCRWEIHCAANIKHMKELETENNRLVIRAYGLDDELSPDVPDDQVTLARADPSADTQRLVSYAIGCIMGRYSLDEPGLTYAQGRGVGFDPSCYRTFAADIDGIIPVTDLEWFHDDAANRFSEFVSRAWADNTHKENLAWIAAQLGAKSGEMPVETIRRYFSSQFFKDHIQTYKKRPIYWLFSSGKQKAFECLVYLHRYNESTLSRMRNEYVTPLFGKLAGRIDHLGGADGQGGLIGAASSTTEKKKLRKQLDVLKKKQAELVRFDDELRHYADMRIKLDLDDGVKVNYGKFGNLLAEVKTITGASNE